MLGVRLHRGALSAFVHTHTLAHAFLVSATTDHLSADLAGLWGKASKLPELKAYASAGGIVLDAEVCVEEEKDKESFAYVPCLPHTCPHTSGSFLARLLLGAVVTKESFAYVASHT